MLAVKESSDYIIAEAFLTLHLARDFTVHRFFSTHLWHHFLALKFELERKILKKDGRAFWNIGNKYLTIIRRARMGPESIAHEAEGRMGYWLRGHKGERNNFFSKIQLVGQKYPEWKKF